MRPISRGALRHPARARDRELDRARLRGRRRRRHDHAQAGGRLPRRRPAEAGPDLEPHRPPADPRRRQLERRHPDARLRPARGQAVAAPARPPRRRRARVRLHRGCREGARAGADSRAGPWSASRTTGRPSSPSDDGRRVMVWVGGADLPHGLRLALSGGGTRAPRQRRRLLDRHVPGDEPGSSQPSSSRRAT